jgi:hypothetical protein
VLHVLGQLQGPGAAVLTTRWPKIEGSKPFLLERSRRSLGQSFAGAAIAPYAQRSITPEDGRDLTDDVIKEFAHGTEEAHVGMRFEWMEGVK